MQSVGHGASVGQGQTDHSAGAIESSNCNGLTQHRLMSSSFFIFSTGWQRILPPLFKTEERSMTAMYPVGFQNVLLCRYLRLEMAAYLLIAIAQGSYMDLSKVNRDIL